jgi:hypothetical protein
VESKEGKGEGKEVEAHTLVCDKVLAMSHDRVETYPAADGDESKISGHGEGL